MNEKLKAALTKKKTAEGVVQQFYARKAGINITRFSNIIHGSRKPSEREKAAIAAVMNLKVEKLF